MMLFYDLVFIFELAFIINVPSLSFRNDILACFGVSFPTCFVDV